MKGKHTMATPHIKAVPGDFAKTVLMPGDPLRSRFIAQNFLENARLVNDVRGVQDVLVEIYEDGQWRLEGNLHRLDH